jgi:hypothetical protein
MEIDMKKVAYISLFVLLGIVLQFIIHALIEMGVIKLLTSDFEKYSLGLSWENWYLIHHIGTVILLVVGVLFGLWAGFYFWKK